MNKNEIIGYKDYYYDKYEYSRIGPNGGTLHEYYVASDLEKFFFKDKNCPFCGTSLKEVFIGMKSGTMGTDLFYERQVFECPKCFWWTYKTHFSDSDDSIGSINADYTDTRYYAIAKKFDIADKFLPIDVLKYELQKRKDILYNIDPYKLEELCQDILKGIFDCEVLHVGQTGDGGKDLIVLASDDPILVQIKRRQNPNSVELVKGIREFIGTLFIEDRRSGIYISTAERFSAGAKNTVTNLLNQRKLDYFQFIDYDKLCSLIDTTLPSVPRWKEFVNFFYEDPQAHYYDTEEKINEWNISCQKIRKKYGL